MKSGKNTEVLAEVNARRQYVTSWIQNNLRPVERLIKYDDLFPDSPNEPETLPTEFEVREYQLDAWGALWDARQEGETHGLVHLATGLGKTSVAVFDAMKFREEFKKEHGRDPKIMFTVHQNDILRQAAERFKAFMPDASTGFYNGKEKDTDKDITFATLQALRANLNTLESRAFDYIIDDEVHHSKAKTYEKVIRHFKPTFRLGLTATPNRADEKDIRDIYGNELYSKGLPEALSEGWLASPDYHIVFDDAVKTALQSGFEANSLSALQELFNVQPRNHVIANNIKEEMERIGLEFGSVKTIVFCQNIEHAEEMAELLNGKSYHSGNNKRDRRNIFHDFKDGNLQVITTRDMFNEGVDIPDARLLVFLRSTSSQTVFEQQLGRGLRKTLGKERVSILDFVANVERIAMVKELAEHVKKPRRDGGTSDDRQDNDVFEASDDGFIVHTNHGDFDFDKMTVDLLEKYNELASRDWNKFSDYTNDELVALALEISPDKPIRKTDIDKLSGQRLFPTSRTIADRFGSVRQFHIACEHEPIGFRNITTDALVELALEISPDEPMTRAMIINYSKEKLFPSPTVIYDRFGSLSAFHEACGFDISRGLLDYDAEQLVQLAHELSPDKILTNTEIERLCKEGLFVSKNRLTTVFGSIPAFKKACGSEKIDFTGITAEELIELALEISPNKPLTKAMMEELSKQNRFPTSTLVTARFGGMENFKIQCGFDDEWLANHRRSELIALALELSPDKPISGKMMDSKLSKEKVFPSTTTIIGLFGSIDEFHKACGFNVKNFRAYSNDEIVNLALELSPTQPITVADANNLYKQGLFPGVNTIAKRFGGMRPFQEACGFETKGPSNEELVQLARKLSPDKPMTSMDANDLSKQGLFPSAGTIIQRFGGMKPFQEACGW